MRAGLFCGRLGRMRGLLAFVAFLMASAMSPAAQGEWPEFVKSQFIENSCAPSLEAQGYEATAVLTFCACFAAQIEANFSILEYEDILAAQPNPDGSSADRRLYAAVMACRPQ